MPETETFVLSTSLNGSELLDCIRWIHDLKSRRVRTARIDIRLVHDRLDFAFLWHRHFTVACPSYLIGLPFLETRLIGLNPLSGLLIWLSAHRRSAVAGALVSLPHDLRFGTCLYEKLRNTIARHVRFTDADAKLWGSNEEYRMMRATMLLSGLRLTSVRDLLEDFGGKTVERAEDSVRF